MSILLELLKPRLDLVGNALAAKLNAIVGEAASITLGYKNIKVRVSLLYAGGEVFEVSWVSPEA